MKKCDVCGESLGIMNKFKYSEGYICKNCYKKASRQFTETITQKNLNEIKILCMEERDEEAFGNFKITGKIGNYLLVDETHRKICIPNNRMTSKKVSNPDIYDLSDIKNCEILYSPNMTFDELKKKMNQRQDGSVEYLKFRINFIDSTPPKEMELIANPVRIKSYAFRQSFNFAQRMQEEMNRLLKEMESEGCNEAV